MFFNIALCAGLFLASSVLAVPSGLGARLARRREGRQSQPSQRLQSDVSPGSNIEYDNNWAGAVWAEGDGTFTTITGTFTVPTPSGSTGDSAAAWVGIDGDTCQSAILQTGVDFTVSSDGPVYDAWYEWYPADSYDFSGITISAGDEITLTVVAYSTTSGTATIENLTNGQTVSTYLTGTSDTALCGENAEWIIEDYSLNGELVSFANFGTVTFTNAYAGSYTPSGATILDIEQNNEVLTSVSTDGSSVTITYGSE